MRGLNDQAWVTSALTDEEVGKALTLASSLKRVATNRSVAVLASMNISLPLRDALREAFDFVFPVDEDRNIGKVPISDFVKLVAVCATSSFEKCVYLAPEMMLMKNCDELFDSQYLDIIDTKRQFVFLENGSTSVFVFRPSLTLFKSLIDGVHFNNGYSGIDAYLKKWSQSQANPNGNIQTSLPEMYNRIVSQQMLGTNKDISIVNFGKAEPSLLLEEKNSWILFQLIMNLWKKIQEEDVAPLIERCSSATLIDAPFTASVPYYEKEPIAIVGMSCRYPSCKNLEEFWNLLFQGGDGTGNPPPFRWLQEQSLNFTPDCRKTNAGFLNVPIDEFDAKFFGVSPKEALFMDPQLRLLHEVIWESLEDAAINPHLLRGTSGSVFLGSWLQQYKDNLMEGGNPDFYRMYMGNSIGAMSARISFLLGMTGPSIATESGCSSAMVALSMACKSLQMGDTNLALAAGVNLLLHAFEGDAMPMVVAPDGHSKTFDEKADGFARAEGCGVLVLKRLSDALKSGDRIWALIRGTGMSQEGVSKSMGTPTVHAESLAMDLALNDAKVPPEQVSYVEAHGTGTVVGDPLEVAAIAKAYHSKDRETPLIISSVKTNVGHTESCSGITGIMKVVLSLVNETIPPHINFTKLNPAIDLDAVPAMIPLTPIEWKKTAGKPRLAGVSSFGITGTDAHVIVEEAPNRVETNGLTIFDNTEAERSYQTLNLSAKTEEALDALLERYQTFLESPSVDIADICHTAKIGRADFPHRAVIMGRCKDEILQNIEKGKLLRGEAKAEEEAGKICFLFPGSGSQTQGMAQDLYKTSPVFQMHIDECEQILQETYQPSVKEALWGGSPIEEGLMMQLSIFCVEYALLRLWESWGVKPDYVLGHSLGEYAASVCAGILSVRDAIKLVANRLIDRLPPGRMLAVKADKASVDRALRGYFGDGKEIILDYAAFNYNEQTVVAGNPEVVIEFAKYLKEKTKLKCVMLDVHHAFHSRHLDAVIPEFGKVTQTVVNGRNLKCGYISALKGDLIEPEEIDSEYWVNHLRQPVNFLGGNNKALGLGCDIFIEIGPQPVLTVMTMMNSDRKLLCLPSLKKNEENWATLLGSLGQLYLQGVKIDWAGLDQFLPRRKVRLPHYPFIGKKFWPDMNAVTGVSIHPLVGSVIPNASSTKLFQSGLNLRSHEYVKDHAIGEHVVFPGAGYLEMCLAAGLATVEGSTNSLQRPTRPMKVENLEIQAPLELIEGKTKPVQTVVELNTSKETGDWNDATVKIFHKTDIESNSSSSWLSHATATFSPLLSPDDNDNLNLEENVSNNFKKLLECEAEDDQKIAQVYDKLDSIGLKFGPAFRSVEKVWKDPNEGCIVTKLKAPTGSSEGQQNQYIVHPIVLDAMIQSIMMLKVTASLKKKLYVPIKIGKFIWLSFPSPSSNQDIYVYVTDKSSGNSSSDNCCAILVDSTGHKLAVMSKVELIDTTARTIESVLLQQTNIFPDMWEEVWRPTLGTIQQRVDLHKCNAMQNLDSEQMRILDKKYNDLEAFPEVRPLFGQLEKVCYLNVVQALYQCGWSPSIGQEFQESDLMEQLKIIQAHRKLFHHYMDVLSLEGVLEKVDTFTWKVIRNPPSLDEIRDFLKSEDFVDLAKTFQSTLLFTELGRKLCQILQGNESALRILFPEDTEKKQCQSAGDFYAEFSKLIPISAAVHEIFSAYLKSIKDLHRDGKFVFRILEVGAGTGQATDGMLQMLKEIGIPFELTFTDVSAAFFSAAEKRFQEFGKSIIYRKFNMEEDPMSQGFLPEYYDYITAVEVIHVAKNIEVPLRNIRTLLKPMGRFGLGEQTRVNRLVTFLFGLLEGYWRFEDFHLRPNHCTLSVTGWKNVLESNGFELNTSCQVFDSYHSWFAVNKCVQTVDKHEAGAKVWVVFHQEDNPVSKYLVEKIKTVHDRRVILVTSGSEVETKSDGHYILRKNVEQDFVDTLNQVIKMENVTLEGVLYCWSLEGTSAIDEILQPYFYLLKTLGNLKSLGGGVRIVSITEGTTAPVEDISLSNIHSSTVWALTKSFRNERTEFNCRCIDIGGPPEALIEDDLLQIFLEMWSTEKLTQVRFHEGKRYSPKFASIKPKRTELPLPPGTDRFQLILPESLAIADLQFGHLDTFSLEDEEVEIHVKASALNFKDILNIIKPTEEFKDSNAVGFDYAGIIKRIGSKVTKWKVGDRVFGVNTNGDAFPSHSKQHENEILPVPDHITLCEAATLPAVVATAYHCLVDVAKVKSTDNVLIHTASGGVGLAAIQICRNIGAKIICTAGSKRKRNFLRSLGIQNVFHSRNTEYGDKILEVTIGHGVDVVLNSLTSEGFKEATLKALTKGGRFVEMSKLSIWKPEEVAELRPDVRYSIVDLSSMEKSEWSRLFTSMQDLIKDASMKPIPYTRFDGTNIREALQYLQKAKHIGKVVCVMPEVKQVTSGQRDVNVPLFNSHSTYLITGGLGGIGFTVCKWMVEKQGAKHVILAGRSAPTPQMEQSIANLNKQNDSNVFSVRLDVGDFTQCEDLIRVKIPCLKLPPLRGVMHAAGTLQDGLLQDMDWPIFSLTFSPKINGTFNLHQLTKDLMLEHFVLFSSMAAVLGSPGQANHTAGNVFEDTIAHFRQSTGLPATTINWGQWGEVGVATEVDIPGLRPMSNGQGITALEYALKSQKSKIAVVNIESFYMLTKLVPTFSSCLDELQLKSRSSLQGFLMKTEEFWEKYDAIVGDDHREMKMEFFKDQMRNVLRSILKLDESDVIDDDTNLQDMGVDSLMFVELKNGLQTMLGDRITVSVTVLRDCTTLNLLSDMIVRLAEGDDQKDAEPPSLEEVAALIREDSELPEHIRAGESQTTVQLNDVKVVLLTGCSGTLGPYLLRELTAGSDYSTQITQVICLMRPHKTLSGEERLSKILQERDILSEVDMSKVRVICGNVAESHMGLEDSLWEELISIVDAVVHSAALVQHTEYYRKKNNPLLKDMRAVNIGGTKNVLEFCTSGDRLKQLCSISTLLATTRVEEGRMGEMWPEVGDYDGITTFAYPVTKFVGDLLLKEAVLNRGIPAKIIRLPMITGDSRSGRFMLEHNHFMLRNLFVLKSGMVTSNPFPMMLLPVNTCASATFSLFFDERCPNEIYNVTNDKPQLDQEIVGVAARLDYTVKVVGVPEYIEKMREVASEDNSPLAIFKDTYINNDAEDVLSVFTTVPCLRHWVTESGTPEAIKFAKSKKIEKFMPHFYETVQPSTEYLYRDLKFAKDAGWIQKFGA